MIGHQTFREELRKQISGEIRFDEPAQRHTSIGVGGPVDALLFPADAEELARAIAFLRKRRIPFLPVGNWTNLIVRDGGFRGALVSLARLRGLQCREESDGSVHLLAGAGCPLSDLVHLSVHDALTGMEFCAGIPGSLGGAIRMNAGAFGGEIKDIVESVDLLDGPGTLRTARRDALPFSYRTLDLPAESIIIGATVRLRRGETETIAGRVREIVAQRREKHPLEFRNAGSVFKNPQDCPAGRLIEAAGLKGVRIGDAQVSEKHANFIVNLGHATAGEILRLVTLVQQRVLEKSGRNLETEIRIIGEP